MGQATLVGDNITAGERLIQSLAKEKINVEAAAWIRIAEDENWHLYLASDVVRDSPRTAYGLVHAAVRKLDSPLWMEPLDVKLITAESRLAQGIAAISRQMPGSHPMRYGGGSLGGESIDQAYIYPPVQSLVAAPA